MLFAIKIYSFHHPWNVLVLGYIQRQNTMVFNINNPIIIMLTFHSGKKTENVQSTATKRIQHKSIYRVSCHTPCVIHCVYVCICTERVKSHFTEKWKMLQRLKTTFIVLFISLSLLFFSLSALALSHSHCKWVFRCTLCYFYLIYFCCMCVCVCSCECISKTVKLYPFNEMREIK